VRIGDKHQHGDSRSHQAQCRVDNVTHAWSVHFSFLPANASHLDQDERRTIAMSIAGSIGPAMA
jgi:hypothetical protein